MSTKQSLGDYGETLAAQYLKQMNYEIHETKWKCKFGEVDIIARMNETWVFVEVKTRRGQKTASAFANITPKKQGKFIKTVQTYLSMNTLDDVMWRIDAIAVAIPKHGTPIIDHVEDAFDW